MQVDDLRLARTSKTSTTSTSKRKDGTPLTLPELIERLELMKAELDPHRLTMAEYQQVGWAMRPLSGLIEQAKQECELQSLDTLRVRTAIELLGAAPLAPSQALVLFRQVHSPSANPSPVGVSTSTGGAAIGEASP